MSGGSDSTALLHVLSSLGHEFGLTLSAAHFDHRVREGSDREAELVAARCAAVGIQCRVGTADRELKNQGEYRDARYAFLESEVIRSGADRVVLAHQYEDQEETILLHLLRGTGLRGLAGIPELRGRYARPLLGFRKDELREYLTDRGIEWCEDSSNEDPRYARTRVRNALLPMLREVPAFQTSLTCLGRSARVAEAGAERRAERQLEAVIRRSPQAHGGVQIARLGLLDYDRADQAQIVRNIARTLGFRLGRRGTEAAVQFVESGLSGTGLDLAHGLRMTREYDRIRFHGPTPRKPDRDLTIYEAGVGAEALELGGRSYVVHWGRRGEDDPWTAAFPLRRLKFPIRVRAPRPGDRIRLRAGSRKLKKLLNERRVPRSERGQVPVLVGADERVLWVVGHSIESSDQSDCNEEMFTFGVDQL